MKRILSGIQPSGAAHIGNYFGMMRPAIEMQHDGEAYYFIADYHALTSLRDPDELRGNVRSVALDFLACGLDPEKSVFYRQSDVPEVNELAWILSTMTPMGLLERCHSYKDKLARGLAPSHGLFAYPILMAADILIVDSDIVPVGRDQKQHIEVARDIAVKVNECYGEVLRLPEPDIRTEVAVIPGLDGQKMSKSYENTIPLFLPEKKLRKQVMKIVTDSTPVEEPKDPDNSTIVALFKLFAEPAEVSAMEDDFRAGGSGYGDFKQRLFEKIRDYFAPMAERRAELKKDPEYIEKVLQEGAKRARETADKTLHRVRQAVGLK